MTAADGFTVKPASAKCTAEPAAAKVTAGIGGSRTVSLGLSAVPGEVVSSAVRVDCTPPGHAPVTATATFAAAYADSCDDPLGALADGVTARSGTVARNAACVSPQRPRDGGSARRYWARRHTFTLVNPAVLRVDAASPTRNGLDVYVLVLEGHAQDGTGTVLGRDDNSGLRSGARLAGLRLEPGDYTVEVTTANRRHTGGYRLRVQARLGVRIDNLHGSSRIGTGPAVDHFTVLPADATCTPDTGTVTDLGDGQRTLTAGLTAVGSTTITVTCRRAGYRTAAATATLTALDPIDDVTVYAASGGTCIEHTGTLDDGVDSQYACTMTRGQTMTVQADATSPSTRTVLGWAATGVRAVPSLGDLEVSVLGDTVTFTRTATATVTCTNHGRVTITARTGVAVHHTTQVAVTCQPPVQITNYTPGTRNGQGPITGTYNVTPAAAHCKARNAGGITGTPVPGGTGTARTVTVTATATGTLDIEIECEADHHATSTATAQFRADDQTACVSPLGVLRHGTRTFASSLSATNCVSAKRPAASTSTFRAHRYSFTLASSGWVSVDLGPTGTGRDALDTYLLLLGGNGSGGAVLHSHNNLSGDATQLGDVYLAAGDYTIEATTALPDATGGYRIAVEGDFAVQSDELPAAVTATVGQTAKARFDYLPHDATVTVQSVSPQGLTASVTALHGSAAVDLTPDKATTTTVTLAFTASGHTSTQKVTVNASCAAGYRALQDGACQPLAPELDESCFQSFSRGRTNSFGRQWRETVVARVYENQCASVSRTGRVAAYYVFSVPSDATSRATYEVELDLYVRVDEPPIDPFAPVHWYKSLPDMDVALWSIGSDGQPASPVRLTSSAEPTNRRERMVADVGAGDYVVELVPRYAAAPTVQQFPELAHKFTLAVLTPSARQHLEDAFQLGNLRRGGGGATLAGFLDARGTLDYGESTENPTNNDDLFDPESPLYPWLQFGVDRCSIPAGPIGWVEDRILDVAHNYHLYFVRDLVNEEYLVDYADFYGVEVPIIYACMRHDFNWKNPYRIKVHFDHDTAQGIWNSQFIGETNRRIEDDILILCHANLKTQIESSSRYTWTLSQQGLDDCKGVAELIHYGLDLVPVSYSDYENQG